MKSLHSSSNSSTMKKTISSHSKMHNTSIFRTPQSQWKNFSPPSHMTRFALRRLFALRGEQLQFKIDDNVLLVLTFKDPSTIVIQHNLKKKFFHAHLHVALAWSLGSQTLYHRIRCIQILGVTNDRWLHHCWPMSSLCPKPDQAEKEH